MRHIVKSAFLCDIALCGVSFHQHGAGAAYAQISKIFHGACVKNALKMPNVG